MLSIHAMGQGASGYYLGLAGEDYYLEGGEPPGTWWGMEHGQVRAEDLVALMRGERANGVQLVRPSMHGHQPGWDLTFSAPKSVSVLWAMSPPDVRASIQLMQQEAVEAALRYLERFGARARRGHGGRRFEPVKLVAALFEHGTSRAQDPQLHTHALLMNVGRRADSSVGAIWSRGIYMHKMAAGALYRAELGRLLRERLGLQLERDESSFRVVGVSDAVLRTFSKRREAILEQLMRTGGEGAAASEFAALETRSSKDAVARAQLFERWAAEGEGLGFGSKQAAELLAAAAAREVWTECPGINSARMLYGLTFHEARFGQRDVVRRVAEELQCDGAGALDVLRESKRVLADAEVVAVSKDRGYPVYTTREMLTLEERVRHLQRELSGRSGHQIAAETAVKAAQRHPSLRDEQREAVVFLTSAPGSLQMLSGLAGTGKTYVQRVCREVWEEAGFRVVGAALSAKAAGELQDGSGIRSRTIASLLKAADVSRVLDARTVLVIDEASMVGTRQMERLLGHAAEAGAKVVLVGDPKQLLPIEAGEPFLEMLGRGEHPELRSITRQREPWMRQAVLDLAEGRVGEALGAFKDHGQLERHPNPRAAEAAIVQRWGECPVEPLVLASTRAEVSRLNAEVQRVREQRGELGHLVSAEPRLRVGDRVVFGRNDAFLGVRNGDVGVVAGSRRAGEPIDVRHGDRVVSVHSRDVSLGYVVTTHKAQGVTVETAVALIREASDIRMVYVQASRSRGRLTWRLPGHDGPDPSCHSKTAAARRAVSTSAMLGTVMCERHQATGGQPDNQLRPGRGKCHDATPFR
jgi:conjugative relaxase-like TrwC/TraI family protein